MIDIYRPLTVMLDAIEFAAKQALDQPKPKAAPPPVYTVDHSAAIEHDVRSMFPHLDITVRLSATHRERQCFARCDCGARFSLRPLSERRMNWGLPGCEFAQWLLDGLDAHRCEERS